MAQNIAIDILLKERFRLKHEKAALIAEFNAKISEIETSIERIEGKEVWDYGELVIFDDENSDCIKGSIEN